MHLLENLPMAIVKYYTDLFQVSILSQVVYFVHIVPNNV